MTEQGLDEADIRPVLQHLRGRRMPEEMTRPGLGEVVSDKNGSVSKDRD
jgi:hypothetical protein